MICCRKLLVLISCCLLVLETWAVDSLKVYPTHWWTGMKNTKLQLLVHATNIKSAGRVALKPYAGVKMTSVSTYANPNYLTIYLDIGKTTAPGLLTFTFHNTTAVVAQLTYSLQPRNTQNGKTRIKGINSSDLIYLIMPDRFSNGDTSNDRIAGLKDQSLDRSNYFKRHGGDLKGIQNYLGYLQQLGVTALWLNPVLLNDMPDRTEHGYAFTDHYTIDPRLGGASAYRELIDSLHKRGMKIIQDAVYNHVGIEHFLYRDLPDSSWFHWWPVYTNTTYKDQVLMDPYAAQIDKKRMSNGWFSPVMPDLNQNNPQAASFLIQHAIWCTEEFGLDGWRIDTYAYNDLDFMNRCNKALLDEYPQLHLFGETWVHGIPNQSFFARNKYDIPYKSNLPGVTDFQLNLYGIVPALTQAVGWTEGVNRLYLTTTNDFVYADPGKNVIFLDNHDISRFFSVVGEDIAKQKMGIAWLLTFRGIPQLYYGTEILMKNFADPDGLVRLDFPGGWSGDAANKFEPGGRTPAENDVYNYVRTLANYRKTSPALTTGKLMQYVPEDGVYVYFRYTAVQTVMCVMNPADQVKEIDMHRFGERTKPFTKARNIIDGVTADINNKLKVPAKTLWVGELLP
ncbi:alpha-amylase [Niastella yeongjuensis]|uniref:Alpha-amylase n=1 Tax=Niastella yeongjuensis TaxID=354355 RepID=A0A1V9E4E9_9BACT|nr:glycoside hydrolase family 13 protein [Niastella yeongjuensis]OQP41000.1 alpha-amylase [Niastella yeongjuensis]SEO95238.1 Glycosidase [Niastella yeongjuensis]